MFTDCILRVILTHPFDKLDPHGLHLNDVEGQGEHLYQGQGRPGIKEEQQALHQISRPPKFPLGTFLSWQQHIVFVDCSCIQSSVAQFGLTEGWSYQSYQSVRLLLGQKKTNAHTR